jgi:hypothetical protein
MEGKAKNYQPSPARALDTDYDVGYVDGGNDAAADFVIALDDLDIDVPEEIVGPHAFVAWLNDKIREGLLR